MAGTLSCSKGDMTLVAYGKPIELSESSKRIQVLSEPIGFPTPHL